ncbi:hypothetical protein BX666DRAFT_2032430 [Dichotomocladium elegans]|nr:hypothetical protein BX666DRAFT_2032430 [Dichotomocladium elegans]
MAYRNWGPRVEVVTRLRWYEVEQLIQFAERQRQRLFNENWQALSVIASSDCPVARNSRFPRDKIYICEGIGHWGYIIDRLKLNFCILRFPDQRLERHYPDIETIGDAELVALEGIHEILGNIADNHSLIDRQFFEERYRIQWTSNNGND